MPTQPSSDVKTIGIVGSRRRDSNEDFGLTVSAYLAIREIYGEVRLVSGGCPTGGDHFAEMIAKQYGLTITIHYPNWELFGKAAGPIRNTKIARDCDVLLALVAPDRTGGTEDTIKKTEKMGKKVIFVE